MPSLDSRNFLNHARPGQVDLDHRCDHHAGGSDDVERLRAEMAGTIARGYPDREGAFGILFSDRHVRRSQHCPELAVVDLLDVPALRWIAILRATRGRMRTLKALRNGFIGLSGFARSAFGAR